MTARTEEAARQITLEAGIPLAQSRREWQLSIDQFRWYAEEARRITGQIIESRAPGGRLEVHHEPVGVVAAFTAWNFPAVLIARKVAPALAAGCSVIVRPSRETPGTAAVLMDCLVAAGVPAGVVGRIVTGGERPSDKNKGFFYAPTAISHLPDSALALAEENFGPIAAITSFQSDDEVYTRANSTDLGLSAYAFTQSAKRMRETVARLEAGMVGINSFALAAAEAPLAASKLPAWAVRVAPKADKTFST